MESRSRHPLIRWPHAALLGVLLLLLAACGGQPAPGGGNPDPDGDGTPVTSTDGRARLWVPTAALADPSGVTLAAVDPDASLELPPGAVVVDDLVYRLELGGASALSPAATLTMTYDPAAIGGSGIGAQVAALAIFRAADGSWEQLNGCDVDSTRYTVSCLVDGPGTFALLHFGGDDPAPEGTILTINGEPLPDSEDLGEVSGTLRVTLEIAAGGAAVDRVELLADGAGVTTTTLASPVAAEAREQVTVEFDTSLLANGRYELSLVVRDANGRSGVTRDFFATIANTQTDIEQIGGTIQEWPGTADTTAVLNVYDPFADDYQDLSTAPIGSDGVFVLPLPENLDSAYLSGFSCTLDLTISPADTNVFILDELYVRDASGTLQGALELGDHPLDAVPAVGQVDGGYIYADRRVSIDGEKRCGNEVEVYDQVTLAPGWNAVGYRTTSLDPLTREVILDPAGLEWHYRSVGASEALARSRR